MMWVIIGIILIVAIEECIYVARCQKVTQDYINIENERVITKEDE